MNTRENVWIYEDEYGEGCGVFVEGGKVFVYDSQNCLEAESVAQALANLRACFVAWGENNTLHDYSEVIEELDGLIEQYSHR